MPRQSRGPDEVNQDLAIIGHLEQHLAALSDSTSRRLLSLASTVPITNSDLSRAARSSRNTTWYQLSKLTRLGLLEKKGQKYSASPYALFLIEASGALFRSAVNGKMPRVDDAGNGSAEGNPPAPPELVALAEAGVKVMYDRGILTQDEYDSKMKLIQEFRT